MMARATCLALALLLAAPLARAGDDPGRAATDLGIVIDPSKPLKIRAEEFEASRQEGGGDVITFSRSVVATQEQLRLTCNWLEARYPEGGGNPDRITARGSVHATQPGAEMTCTELVYDRLACTITCTSDQGPAVVVRGDDVMRGREIETNLCDGKLRVRGGAAIEFKPSPKEPKEPEGPLPEVVPEEEPPAPLAQEAAAPGAESAAEASE